MVASPGLGLFLALTLLRGEPADLIVRPNAFPTLVNPNCSHCVDEAKRRAAELRAGDPVLVWTRGYSQGGVIPIRFFLNSYRVISDSYGVFVHDPDAGYARGFAPGYHFRFHGWRNGVMVMKDDRDDTLYSCLTGIAFAGPRKGSRLTTVPTLVSQWGPWTAQYPNAVAYHMFEKYQPTELPRQANADSLKSRRGSVDARLPAEEPVLGLWVGEKALALPTAQLSDSLLRTLDTVQGPAIVLHDPKTGSTAAYWPRAHQPRKWKAPAPDVDGVSPRDDGVPLPEGAALQPAVAVDFQLFEGKVRDRVSQTTFDIAGRGIHGPLTGWTLEPIDSVTCKWFAWVAEHPETMLVAKAPAKPGMKEIAGSAEFLRLLPKPWGILKAIDVKARTITLLIDGEKTPKAWPVEPDAEIKVAGWWGRLEQFTPDQRVWVWLALDRNKQPKSVAMLADAASESDIHGKECIDLEPQRARQKQWLSAQWKEQGLPATLSVKHVFSGEIELLLDHEALRWGRALKSGDATELAVAPPIHAVVKQVSPWRERTVVRLVVGELQASDLQVGQRISLRMTAPKDESNYPLDIDYPRGASERADWFLANVYCVCGIENDICTGMFYTLASCNPNGCGAPQATRNEIKALIEKGSTDRQIWDTLVKKRGALMARPHLR